MLIGIMEDDKAASSDRREIRLDFLNKAIKPCHHGVGVCFICRGVVRIDFRQSLFNLMNDGFRIHRVEPDMRIKSVMSVVVMVIMSVVVMVVMPVVVMIIMPVVVMPMVVMIIMPVVVMPVVVMIIMPVVVMVIMPVVIMPVIVMIIMSVVIMPVIVMIIMSVVVMPILTMSVIMSIEGAAFTQPDLVQPV